MAGPAVSVVIAAYNAMPLHHALHHLSRRPKHRPGRIGNPGRPVTVRPTARARELDRLANGIPDASAGRSTSRIPVVRRPRGTRGSTIAAARDVRLLPVRRRSIWPPKHWNGMVAMAETNGHGHRARQDGPESAGAGAPTCRYVPAQPTTHRRVLVQRVPGSPQPHEAVPPRPARQRLDLRFPTDLKYPARISSVVGPTAGLRVNPVSLPKVDRRLRVPVLGRAGGQRQHHLADRWFRTPAALPAPHGRPAPGAGTSRPRP